MAKKKVTPPPTDSKTDKNTEGALIPAIVGTGDLMGYNPGPYDLNLRIQQMQWLIKQDTVSHFMKGCILLEIKEHENLQTFAKILTDDFGGMSQRSAYHYMTFSQKCLQLPKIASFAETNWSKAIALYEGCTDEQLKEIEEKGLDGKVLDEYDGMSVREFKTRLTDLKKEQDTVVSKATKALRDENKALREESAKLRKEQPADPILWLQGYIPEIDRAFEHLGRLLDEMAFDLRMINSDEGMALVESFYQRQVTRLTLFDEKWREYTVQGVRPQK